jgi:VanZ family protein
MEAGAYHGPVPDSALARWLAVAAWCAVIFAFSSIPSLGTDLGTWDLVLRKLAHLTEYAILGVLLARAVGALPAAVALGTAYAVTDEIHQTFVDGRRGAPLDVLIDAVGVVLGVFVWRALVRRRSRSTA